MCGGGGDDDLSKESAKKRGEKSNTQNRKTNEGGSQSVSQSAVRVRGPGGPLNEDPG